VALLGNDGKTKAQLAPPGMPVAIGGREWVRLETSGDVALPQGGWLSVELTNLGLSLELAAPEVTSTALGSPAPSPAPPGAHRARFSERDRRALAQAHRAERVEQPRPRPRETDDR
jgi:hypothetical protein